MMHHLLIRSALLALVFGSAVQAQEPPLRSGPPVGAENDRRGFRPQFVTGPSAGKNLCPV